MPEPQLVMVKWVDSHSNGNSGWDSLEYHKGCTATLICRSVGWLVKETEDNLLIVPHISGDWGGEVLQRGAGEIVIPRVAVLCVQKLQGGKFKRFLKTGR